MASEQPAPTDPVEAYHAVRDGSLTYAMYNYCPDSDNITVQETSVYNPGVGEEATWEAFLDRLKMDECRYIVYDFMYPGTQDEKEITKKKLLYILWAPEGSHVRDKMNLSHHGKRFRDAFGHFDDELHSTYKEWISYPEVVKRLERGAK
ncbi:cofilin [Penicillium maclennaniae]|uniref:cofilin n=1 Tax=Penicillium maclennaniae TaxID=1343394 RepID=UPI0025419487|nr:cofilin [Penicillium maclennaniae]KAJ5661728.1 cofilin [Penicillium maclennaniae]